jgi:nucleotide-binding universal stress UspA family protein
MFSINTILHPTDFSERSQQAFKLACSLASQHQARLLLVYVVSTPPPPPLPYNEAGLGTFEDTAEAAQIRLEELRTSHSNIEIEYVLAEGKPAQEINRIARETDADLIVMGTHGRTGLDRLLMGSVAEHVVRKAPCRVITVREKASDEGAEVGERPDYATPSPMQ